MQAPVWLCVCVCVPALICVCVYFWMRHTVCVAAAVIEVSGWADFKWKGRSSRPLPYPTHLLCVFSLSLSPQYQYCPQMISLFSPTPPTHSASLHLSSPLTRFLGASLFSSPASCCRSQTILHPLGRVLFRPSLPAWTPVKSLLCPLSSFLTVIQDVDSSSLEANYQSFASLMEQRLAELFLVAGRQGPRTVRSRRATTVGGYTVQVGGIHLNGINESIIHITVHYFNVVWLSRLGSAMIFRGFLAHSTSWHRQLCQSTILVALQG